ncbi:MAG: hypothetical protein HN348_11890 [Proteobacteria bacterium]|nr:hypothetical protein [Pseudomonadota bacterium]
MNDAEIAHQVHALQHLVGARLTSCWQPARDRVILAFPSTLLLLVPRGSHPRVHTTTRRPKNPAKPFSFQGAIRAHLAGRLTGLLQSSDDRIVDLLFNEKRLHLRLTGKSGGLWLLDGNTVLAAYDGPATASLPRLSPRPIHPVSPPRYRPTKDEDWDLAARHYFTEKERAFHKRQRQARLQKNLRDHLARSSRLLEHLYKDLDRSCDAPLLRRKADTLAAHLHTIKRGMDQVSLPDLEQPDHIHQLKLNPTKAPSATLEQMYQKARRFEKAGEQILSRIEKAEQRIKKLEEALDDDFEDPAVLKRIELLFPVHRRSAPIRKGPWALWQGPDGQQVLAGRNARGNRQLTFQVARGHHTWMHIRERPGSHIIIPLPANQSPPLPLLLAAAQIVLAQAKVPEGQAADVQYTQARHIRSIPRDVSGRVIVNNEKVLRVVRDPAVLAGWSRS